MTPTSEPRRKSLTQMQVIGEVDNYTGLHALDGKGGSLVPLIVEECAKICDRLADGVERVSYREAYARAAATLRTALSPSPQLNEGEVVITDEVFTATARVAHEWPPRLALKAHLNAHPRLVAAIVALGRAFRSDEGASTKGKP